VTPNQVSLVTYDKLVKEYLIPNNTLSNIDALILLAPGYGPQFLLTGVAIEKFSFKLDTLAHETQTIQIKLFKDGEEIVVNLYLSFYQKHADTITELNKKFPKLNDPLFAGKYLKDKFNEAIQLINASYNPSLG
jgi:hypothetical protein